MMNQIHIDRNRREKMNEYYINNSSWFNLRKHNIDMLSDIVKMNGGKNVQIAMKYSWDVHPSIITFEADERTKNNLQYKLEKEYNIPIEIKQKTWS